MSAGICVVAAIVSCALPAAAQTRVNLQAYQLGVDVPEAPALVAIGIAPPMSLGSAPKPFGWSAELLASGPATVRAVAVDLSPYFLFGGGIRDLASYRANSLAGRLTRVFTKTLVSVGAASSSDDPDALTIGLGVRSTLHDPHDPVLNLQLPEWVAAAFARAGVPMPDATDENLSDHGVDLSTTFARARREARARKGDPQVSGGWGMRARLADGALSGDSAGGARHTFWINAQISLGPRFDVIGSADWRDAFAATSRCVGGLALRLKGGSADYQVGLRYDAANNVLHPSTLVDARLTRRLGVVTWVDTDAQAGTPAADRRLRGGLLVRWFSASDAAP